MVNPVDIGLRIAQVLDSIGIKMGSYIGKGSNVKKAMFGGKPTMFKPNALEALRGTNANFDDALRLIENEAQFIVNATDAEKIAFLNNVNDYKQFGGPLKQDVVARTEFEQGLGSLKGDIEDLQSSTKDLLTTAKSMKDEAELNVNKAYKDLDDFFKTGGDPFKKKNDKFLGGSMSEEGQIRTGIRQFLQKELKNGRIKLDEKDTARVLKYFPTIEDDPILVFKKIYGDEAYNKAGSFPGAFDIGESYNHYESIFRSKMGEDILKVKDKKYVGDGTLMLTDEVKPKRTPADAPEDDDIPFAEGGIADVRPGFVKGKGVTKVKQIIEYITSNFTPMDAMKEVNKVIGKTGKYKNLKLTQKDIDDIVEGSNDFIFQRDPDNLFVEGSIKQGDEITLENFGSSQFAPKKGLKIKKEKSVDDMSLEDSLTTLEGLGATKMAERFKLKQKYPGITDDLVDKILIDDNPQRKAELIGTLDEAFRMMEKGKGPDEIVEIFKNTTRTKNAKGGRAGYYGGGQAMVEPDLSDIGHGSDALMGRTRLTAPGSQATTSTGLNYLLGEDNDNNRVPFNEGLLVPPKKPVPPANPFNELMRIYKTYEEAMPGVSKDTQQYLQNDFKEKLNNAKISVEAFMTYKMQNNFADGGIAGLRQGYAGGKGVDIARRGFLKFLGGTAAGVVALKTGLAKMFGKESGAVSKKVIDEVIIDGGTGAPAWLQPLVNKALREGTDITKKNAVVDGQVVKSLDTPTGQVDVYYDTRTGQVDIDYIGGNTALGESVNLKYVPGVADEGTKGVKPADEFEAVESIPEGQMSGPDDFQVEFGENASSNVKDLYSDTSELATLGGKKPLIKDISETIKKKKVLKQMNENPDQFVSDNLPDYDPT